MVERAGVGTGVQDPAGRQEEDQGGRGCDKEDALVLRCDLTERKGLSENIPCLHIRKQGPVAPYVLFVHIYAALDDTSHVSGQIPLQPDEAVFFIFPDPAAQTVKEQRAVRRADSIEDGKLGYICNMCFRHGRVLSETSYRPNYYYYT